MVDSCYYVGRADRLPGGWKKVKEQQIDLINALLPGYESKQMLRIRRGAEIASIAPMSTNKSDPAATQVLNLAGDWLSLGGVDLQINGALGLAFTDVDSEHITKVGEICQFLWHQGVDAFLPTLVTTAVEKIQRSLSIFSEISQQHNPHFVTPPPPHPLAFPGRARERGWGYRNEARLRGLWTTGGPNFGRSSGRTISESRQTRRSSG
ncbi:MAG: hypothetical protein GDA56_12940 [Hormoscilla sp. GM7CHS1pb]|nr:hypothetical protein [Hormoscilla sp. GM7CHS1pb]